MSLRQHLRAFFFQQRNQAKQRGIEWDLSYLEWLAILAQERPSRRTRPVSRKMADVSVRGHRPVLLLERQDRQDGSQRQRGPDHQAPPPSRTSGYSALKLVDKR